MISAIARLTRSFTHLTAPITPGLTFHGPRHSHKTWLIEASIPAIAQARRLGHTLNDDIQELYSHVADDAEQRLITALEQHWHRALTTTPLQHLHLAHHLTSSPAPSM